MGGYVFSQMGLNVNPWKSNMMVIGVITKDVLSISKVYPCGGCDLSVKANVKSE